MHLERDWQEHDAGPVLRRMSRSLLKFSGGHS